jgi:hypothetical protein
MMVKMSAYWIIALGILHMVVLGYDAAKYAGSWLTGALWTWEHWGPVSSQGFDLVMSGFAFWSTVGSFAIPMIVLGALVVWMTNRRIPVPRFVGIALLAWGIVSGLAMPTSGFPVLVLVAIGLCFGLGRGAHETSHAGAATSASRSSKQLGLQPHRPAAAVDEQPSR